MDVVSVSVETTLFYLSRLNRDIFRSLCTPNLPWFKIEKIFVTVVDRDNVFCNFKRTEKNGIPIFFNSL